MVARQATVIQAVEGVGEERGNLLTRLEAPTLMSLEICLGLLEHVVSHSGYYDPCSGYSALSLFQQSSITIVLWRWEMRWRCHHYEMGDDATLCLADHTAITEDMGKKLSFEKLVNTSQVQIMPEHVCTMFWQKNILIWADGLLSI